MAAGPETSSTYPLTSIRPAQAGDAAALAAFAARTFRETFAAQTLMMASLEAAMERGARAVWLAVWERNLRAQAFYRKCGFEDCGAKDFVLGRDRQTDRVMVRAV